MFMTRLHRNYKAQPRENISLEDENKLAALIQSPSMSIQAGKAVSPERAKQLYDALTCRKQYVEFPEADHCFYYGDTAHQLMEKTHEWFEKF